MIVAAIPVKDLANAKQRLVRVLDPRQRRELARAMLADVLRAIAGAGLDRVWVVTREPEAIALARAFGAEPLTEPENRGHTAAVAVAQAEAVRLGAEAFLTIPGDVPCVTAAEIRALVDTRPVPPAAVFTPSRSGLGTNGAVLAPPAAMRLRFGEPSFESHLAAARALKLNVRVVPLPGLALDIDDRDDLAALLAAGPATDSARLAAGWQVLHRALLARAASR
jgi:2-phospho-L-lactate/phosphoenolpyruvate guanylyltransferase